MTRRSLRQLRRRSLRVYTALEYNTLMYHTCWHLSEFAAVLSICLLTYDLPTMFCWGMAYQTQPDIQPTEYPGTRFNTRRVAGFVNTRKSEHYSRLQQKGSECFTHVILAKSVESLLLWNDCWKIFMAGETTSFCCFSMLIYVNFSQTRQ